MRILLAVVLCASAWAQGVPSIGTVNSVSGGGGGGTPTLISGTAQCQSFSGPTSGNDYTTTAINDTGGTADFLWVAYYAGGGGSISSITDSNSNTEAGHLTPYGNWTLHYYSAPTVGSGHTWTVHGTSAYIYPVVCTESWSGVTGVFNTGTDFGQALGYGTSTCQPSSAITPSAGYPLILFGMLGFGSGDTFTSINEGFGNPDNPGSDGSGMVASLVQGSPASVQPIATVSNTGAVLNCSIAAFK